MPSQTKEKPMPEDKICFVIAPIGEEGSTERKRSDQILNHVITPVAQDCGYKAVRADRISEPGIITTQVIQHIIDDPLVIADLTGRNPNVFYELALRHALKKPTVQIIAESETIPFDVAAARTIRIDHRDLDSVAACKKELARQISAVEKDSSLVDNPISQSVDLKSLKESGDPLEKSAGEIISLLHNVRAMVAARATGSNDDLDPSAVDKAVNTTREIRERLDRVRMFDDSDIVLLEVSRLMALVDQDLIPPLTYLARRAGLSGVTEFMNEKPTEFQFSAKASTRRVDNPLR